MYDDPLSVLPPRFTQTSAPILNPGSKEGVRFIDGAYQTCPVCRGRGMVPSGFYHSLQVEAYASTGGTEQCRACGGRGIVK